MEKQIESGMENATPFSVSGIHKRAEGLQGPEA